MHDWMGIGLVALGAGLTAASVMKRRSRMRAPVATGAIRPEFAAMGEMIRPLILFAVGIFGLKMTLFYFVLGGERYLTPLDFAGVLFVLAAYAGGLVMATTRPLEKADRAPVPPGERSAA
jgi:hypothetical protein